MMMTTPRKSIKLKIIGYMMLTSVLALLVASAVFVYYERTEFKKRLVQELSTIAEVLGRNTTAALTFMNRKDAHETLSALKAEKHIMEACIYDRSGAVFATYGNRAGSDFELESGYHGAEEVVEFNGGHLNLYRPIYLHGELTGGIYVRSNLDQLAAKQKNVIAITLLILVISSIAAFFVISQFQKGISWPILELAKTARHVSDNKDYAMRAVQQSEDEIGFLTQSFNDMLGEIERRDNALNQTHAQLQDQAQALKKELNDRKKIERALKLSEKRFRTLFDEAPDIYIILDPHGRITDVNQRGLQKLGYARDELVGRAVTDIISPDDLVHNERVFEQIVAGEIPSNVEMRLLAKNDSLIWVMKEFSVQRTSEGEISTIRVVCRDVTERKNLREELERAQRLETAGRVAGQIAHDFNNLLGPLAAYPSLIRSDLPPGHSVIGMVDEMEAAANKIAEINQQLLTLARRGHYATSRISINDVLNKLLASQQYEAGPSIAIEKDFESPLPLIEGGDAQLTRALSNVVNNACEAMQHDGTVVLRTRRVHLQTSSLPSYKRIKPGNYVRIDIIDSGCGISADIRQRIFDPFFTTKTMDKLRGSGLGLSVVHGVIKDHNGYIDIESESGRGTTFTIYLPAADERLRTAAEKPEPALAGGTESVLIVDDDALQRKVIAQLLQRLGYQTETVASGEEAVKTVRVSAPDLLILDMVMEGIDGAETYKRILQIHPKQKAIILSGYAISKRVRHALRMGAGRFVPKPISLPVLADAVRKELDGVPSENGSGVETRATTPRI